MSPAPRPLCAALFGVALAITASAAAQAETGERYADANGALGVAKGPAASPIRVALTAKSHDCTGIDFQPRRCALADNAINADVHYSIPEGGERRFAFVSVRWQSDPTGNAIEARGLIFSADRDGPFRLLGETDLIGDSVSDVVFEAQRITYATAYLRGGDSRTLATGRRRYEIPLRADGIGPVVIQRSGFKASAETPAAPADEALLLVSRLYEAGESSPLAFDDAKAAGLWLSPELAKLTRRATALSRRCPIYDGDARLGGAQGAGGPVQMRYEPVKSDDPANRRVVLVTAAQAEAPRVISKTRVVLVQTSAGWRIDDLMTAGQGYKAELRSRMAQCR